MTEAVVAAVGGKLLEVEAKTLGDTLADVNAEALLCAQADAVAEVEAKTLHLRLSDIKVEVLDDTVAKVGGQDTWRQTGCSDSQGTVEHSGE